MLMNMSFSTWRLSLANSCKFSTTRHVLEREKYYKPTIYALSTAPGKAAVAIIRISGPASTYIFRKLTGSSSPPQARLATVRKLFDPKSLEQGRKKLIDESLCLFFKGPHSYSGEDLLEVQCHGGRAVINAIMKAVSSLHTEYMPIRYAERGEFSKRGFQNGRFDLTEAEGINELVNAETEVQRLSVLSSTNGDTRKLFNSWRKRILHNVALLTTVIDFGEDHEVDEVNHLFDKVASSIVELEKEMQTYLKKTQKSQILMDGIKMTLSGPPNAGKSSILNILADDEKAIVSSIAGTTRDAIDIPLAINGYKVILGDTAGIRNATNEIEQEGIKRAHRRTKNADLNLVILPADESDSLDSVFMKHISTIREQQSKELLIIVNKSDLMPSLKQREILIDMLSDKLAVKKDKFMFISCKTKEGIQELVNTLTSKFRHITWTDRNESPVVISKRARDILEKSVLQGFKDFKTSKDADDIVLATEGLRFSMEGIGKITGQAIGVEEILSTVFSEFCIGK